MKCEKCRSNNAGSICDSCGALLMPPLPCVHLRRSESFDGAYRDKHGLVTWRRLSWCLDCDHIVPGPVVPMAAPTTEAQ